MCETCLIIITGAPGTGKTTLGRRIAGAFALPFVHKDGIKETLFDSLGWKDRAWSNELGAAAMEILFYLVEVQLRAGRSVVVEGNFYPEFHTPRFAALQERYSFTHFQILCTTDAQALAERYQRRATSGERHPGHLDQELIRELDPFRVQDRHGLLGIGGRALEVDTSDFTMIEYEGLFQAIASMAKRQTTK